jgi:hypothetical protein
MPIQRALIGLLGSGGHDRAGEVAGPGGVRHVPVRIHGLVLDVVKARRGLQPDLPDRDPYVLTGARFLYSVSWKAERLTTMTAGYSSRGRRASPPA